MLGRGNTVHDTLREELDVPDPEEIDRMMIREMNRMMHERRMKRIREMDLEEWAQEAMRNAR